MKTSASLALALLCLAPGYSVSAAEAVSDAAASKTLIVLAGDSTVTTESGWGKGFARTMKETVEVINLAKGGRSSSSFLKEGLWQRALDLKPDYVLLQFGHNDEPGHQDRATDPQTTYKQHMTRYVDEARAAGIEPVLVTSLSRRQWTREGTIRSSLIPYVEVVKEIAAEKHVPLIDLHAHAIEVYEAMGRERILEISPLKNADPDSPNSDTAKQKYDGTHLNEKGSGIFGPWVAKELGRVVPALAPAVKEP